MVIIFTFKNSDSAVQCCIYLQVEKQSLVLSKSSELQKNKGLCGLAWVFFFPQILIFLLFSSSNGFIYAIVL